MGARLFSDLDRIAKDAATMADENQPLLDGEHYLTDRELSERLKISRRTLQDYRNNGINVIPNVTWSTPDSYDYSFTGIEKNGTIAINCTGVKKSDYSKYLWLKGYNEAIRRLEPTHIIRYGEKMPEENEEISTYFENENYKKLKDGRKR